jgi:hypothetical protein
MRFIATCPICGVEIACTEMKDADSPLLTEAFDHIRSNHPETITRIGPNAVTFPHTSYRVATRPPVGTRVRLTQYADRFPHFIADKGAVGTVTVDDEYLYAVKMDDRLDGCEEWGNEVTWLPEDDDHEGRDGHPCMEFTNPPVELIEQGRV